MPSARVRSHTRNGRRVRGYSQHRSRAQVAADVGVGSLAAVGGVTTALLGLTEAVVTIVSFALMALFGALLGVRFYKRNPGWIRRTKQRAKRTFGPRRVGARITRGPQSRGRSASPWRGTAPWAESTTVHQRLPDGSWKKVG